MTPQNKKHNINGFRSTFAQTLAAVGFSVYSVNIGLIFGMPTIVIGALRGADSPLGLTDAQASWFGSLYFIAQPLGSVISGFLQDWLGRKKSLILINLPQMVAWLMLYFSTKTVHLFVSIAFLGLTIGFLEAPILSYVGEVTQPRLRGVFSSFLCIFYNSGIMIEAFLGASLPWRTMVLCNLLGPITGLICMALLPESPAWLVTKGRLDEAQKAFQWLRGWAPKEAVKEELDNLVEYVRSTSGSPNIQNTSCEYKLVTNTRGNQQRTTPRKSWRTLLEPEVRTAFRIVLIFFITAPCSSLFAMRPFFIEILDSLNLPMKSHTVLATCGTLLMVGSVLMGLLIKLLGKRKLSFLSLGTCVFCCFGLAAYLLLGVHFPWTPIVFFGLSYFFGGIATSLPWIFLIELFPLRARSIGSGLCAAFAYVIFFLVTKTYYIVASWLDVWGTCFLYGVIGLMGLVYLYLELPETEGVPLELIERKLSERRSSRRKSSRKNKNDELTEHV